MSEAKPLFIHKKEESERKITQKCFINQKREKNNIKIKY